MKKKKDVSVCPNCFSKNILSDKGILPGGVEAFEFDVGKCDNCGYRGRTFLLVNEDEYDQLKKEKEKLKIGNSY